VGKAVPFSEQVFDIIKKKERKMRKESKFKTFPKTNKT
jgi:hypothetical protein